MKKIEYLMNSLEPVTMFSDGSIQSARACVEEITKTSFFGFFKKEVRQKLHVHRVHVHWKMSETGEYCSNELHAFCQARVELMDMEAQSKKQEFPKQKEPVFAIDSPETHGGYND